MEYVSFPMCCLPLIRCTVHRPCCMICSRGPKEKGMGAPPGAMPILTIKSSGLLKGTIGLKVVVLLSSNLT